MLYHYVPIQAAENVAAVGSSIQSTAAPAGTTHARVVATADVRYNSGANPTAVAADALLPLGAVEFIPICAAQKFAFIGTATVSVLFVKAF